MNIMLPVGMMSVDGPLFTDGRMMDIIVDHFPLNISAMFVGNRESLRQTRAAENCVNEYGRDDKDTKDNDKPSQPRTRQVELSFLRLQGWIGGHDERGEKVTFVASRKGRRGGAIRKGWTIRVGSHVSQL